MSPLLFILVMDVLAKLVDAAAMDGCLAQFPSVAVKFRLSLFADDVALFAHASVEELHSIHGLLDLFGEASGLRPNFQKSYAYPIRVDVESVPALEFPCAPATFPCNYLGLPLSCGGLSKARLLALVDKVAARLPSWRAHLLSPAVRLVLINSVLSALPVYHMLALDLPAWVIKAIDKIPLGRCFFCQGPPLLGGVGGCLSPQIPWGSWPPQSLLPQHRVAV